MELVSRRIYLRPLMQADASIIVESTKDEEIRYMTGTKQTFTLEQIQCHIKNITEDSSRYDFAICLNESDQMIGELSILDIDEGEKRAGFRISMRSIELTGKGYGTEAIQLVLHFVFQELKLSRLQLEVLHHNVRGMKAYEKAGFVKERTIRIRNDEKYADEIIMTIRKEDYEKMADILS